MVLVYTKKVTNRIRYIFNLIFADILNSSVEFTADLDGFKAFTGAKLSYGSNPVNNELFFCSNSFLLEKGIGHKDLIFIDYQGLPAFFPVYNKSSALPFDVFSASFYLTTRYEEYLPYKKDEYGRFSATESISYQNGFLNKPLVNIWAWQIAKLIQSRFRNIKFPGKKYEFIPTIDIDAAWAYKQKGIFRTIGGFAYSLSKLDIGDFFERARVLTGRQKDPFDTYDFQHMIHRKYNLQPIYFILFGDYGLNDKNIPAKNRKFQTLIKSLADYNKVGIHPSYNSNSNPKKLKTEVYRLSKVLNREITKSRQHFLVLKFPLTFRNLINLDITDDYSMGFASKPGFRASICSTYYFFDLELDIQTKLRIHPFAYMEGTLKDYMNVTATEAIEVIKPLIEEVKAVNGVFLPIWHNESLSNLKRWEGWQNVYEEMIKLAVD